MRPAMSTPNVAQGRSMDRIVQAHVRLGLSTRQAFEMFTQSAALQSWLAPLAEVSPTLGGKYELFWEPGEKEHNSTRGCRITALEECRFLSFEWRGPRQFEQFMNDADPLTHVVVFFIPGAEGAEAWTDVYLIHSGWRSTPEWEEARQWFEQAWSAAFAELSRQVNG